MKYFKIKSQVLLVIALLTFSISCNDDSQNQIKPEILMNLSETKTWFESLSKLNSDKNQTIEPRWDKAIVFNNLAEFPYTIDGKLSLPYSEFGLKHQGRNRIIVYKDDKGLFSAHTVSYIPSDKFEGDIKTINERNLLAKHFDGKVSVGPLNSDFRTVLTLKNGVITDHTKIVKDKKSQSSAKIEEWWEQCTNWFQWGGGEWFYLDTSCEIWYEEDAYNLTAYNYGIQYDWFETYYGSGVGSYENNYWAYCINNQLVNPCLSGVANKVLDTDLVSTYNQLIQEIFNSDEKTNLTLVEGQLPPDKIAATNPLNKHDGMIDVTLILDPAKLIGGSQEFIGAVIYHECFHAIIKTLSNGSYASDDQHIAMFTNYLDLLASSLESAYPGMQPGDAKSLILIGLVALDGGPNPTDPDEWPTAFVDKVLNFSGFSRTQISHVNTRYQAMHISGTACN